MTHNVRTNSGTNRPGPVADHRLIGPWSGRPWLLLVMWAALAPLARTEARADATAEQLRREADQAYRVELERLAAATAADAQLGQAIAQRLRWLERRPFCIYLFVPPDELDRPTGSDDSGWNAFFEARRRHAERLREVARQAVATWPAWSYQLLHEALWEWPDDETIRSALGYRRQDGKWTYAADTISSTLGTTPERRYGWEARGYYRIVSPHFMILTDVGAEPGEALARELERFHLVWRQLFFDFWGNGPLLAQRLERGAPAATARRSKHLVLWFRDRQRYVELLQSDIPQVDKTVGIYLDTHRAVVVHGEWERIRTTLWHEVTHQLFAETVRTSPGPGEKGNVWAIEGMALFMESLRWRDNVAVVGGPQSARLQYARYRALRGQFYVPAEEFVRLDRRTVQSDPNIAALYSQAAGWAHFFMTAEAGKYRTSFIQYVQQIYQQRDELHTLWELTGLTPDEMNRRYAAFLRDTAGERFEPDARELVLAFGSVNDDQLAQLPLESLQWLDLSYTPITDRGAAVLSKAKGLRRLSLEGTRITEAALAYVAQLTQLEELDLTGLPLGDEAIKRLAQLPELRHLVLADTQVTDAVLPALAQLPKLEYLDLSGTATTAAGRARLKQQRPALRIESQ
ncbi:MAG: hypothetical protein KatS3mg110_1554 [Pirellulaceae bacterium]|nr:MAG: hypothetical protein KatS3mg110_1554 [Pirellulaceae bacterium]